MAKKSIKYNVNYKVNGADKVDGSFKKIGDEAKTTSDKVGGVNRQVKQTSNLLSKLKNVGGFIGVTSGIALLGGAVRSAFNNIKDFSKANSSLAAVLQKSKSEIKDLTDQQRHLGATTEFSATQVAESQIELAKMGFTMEEIGDTTKGVLSLASSAGVGLSEAAEVLSATLRGFGLDASESGRVTDIMATSFIKSASDMEKFRESMKLVAPIAKAANIDIETTTALLGELANNGLAGSIAGTGLKNLMSKLSNSSSALSKELGFSVKNSGDLVKAFKELKKGNIDLTKATELTDERSKAAFLTMINGIDNVEDLTQALRDSKDAAAKLAEQKLDNLAGDITKLSSAWEGLTLESLGAEKTMRSVVQGMIEVLGFLTRNFGTIIKVVGSATLAFVGYKAGVVASSLSTSIFSKRTRMGTIAAGLFSGSLKKTTQAFKLLNATMKMNPFGLIMGAITAIIPFLGLFSDGVDEGTEALNKQTEAELKRQEVFKKRLDSIDARFQQRQKLSKLSLQELESQMEQEIDFIIKRDDEERASLIKSGKVNEKIFKEQLEARKKDLEASGTYFKGKARQRELNKLSAIQTQIDESILQQTQQFGESDDVKRLREQLEIIKAMTDTTTPKVKEELGLIQKLKKEIKELTEIREKSGDKEEVLNLTKKIELKQKELNLLTKIKKEEKKEKKDKEPKETELEKSLKRIEKMEDDAHLRSIKNQRDRNEEELLMAQEHAIKLVNLSKLTKIQKENEINVINDYYKGLRKEQDNKFLSEEKEQKIIQTADDIKQIVDSAEKAFQARNAFNQEGMDMEMAILEEQFNNKELTEEQYIVEKQKLLDEQHKMDKAAAVQKLAIDTANSLGGLMNYSMNNPMNSVTSGLAGIATYAAGAIQIATQAASVSRLLNSSAPQAESPSGGGMSPDVNQDLSFDGQSAGSETFGTQIPVIKAFITESEITGAIDTASDIEGLSTFG